VQFKRTSRRGFTSNYLPSTSANQSTFGQESRGSVFLELTAGARLANSLHLEDWTDRAMARRHWDWAPVQAAVHNVVAVRLGCT